MGMVRHSKLQQWKEEENIVAAAAAAAPVASPTLAAALVIDMKLVLNPPASTGEGEREGL